MSYPALVIGRDQPSASSEGLIKPTSSGASLSQTLTASAPPPFPHTPHTMTGSPP